MEGDGERVFAPCAGAVQGGDAGAAVAAFVDDVELDGVVGAQGEPDGVVVIDAGVIGLGRHACPVFARYLMIVRKTFIVRQHGIVHA